jgi:hypothetical protein
MPPSAVGGPPGSEYAATPPEVATPPGAESPPQPEAAAPPEPPAESRAALPDGGKKRRAHLGLRIDFESRADDPSLGRLVESTIWVNEAHPAYLRAVVSRSQGYHLALTVAMTLAPLAVEPAQVHEFITTFLERWGEAGSGRGR